MMPEVFRIRRSRSLAVKLYASAVVLVLIVSGVFLALSHTESHRGAGRGEARSAALSRHLALLWSDRTAVTKELEIVLADEGLHVTVYDMADRLVASNVDPPLALERGRHRLGGVIHRHLDEAPVGQVLLDFPQPSWLSNPLFIAFLVMLVVAAAGALLLARSLLRPLSKLTTAAERLGRGDLSARTRLDRTDELGAVSRTFDEMAERITQLVRGQTQLLADISHELRTPLARIRVALDLFQDVDTSIARAAVPGITDDLDELDHLIANVLATARLDLSANRSPTGPGPALQRHVVDSTALLERSAARFEKEHPDHPLRLHIAPDLPSLHVDPALLRRALDNLLDNAAKYSEPGRAVEVDASAEGPRCIVRVKDHGIGIDSAHVPHLFTPFFRVNEERGERGERGGGLGLGLGLSLARRIVVAHGGDVRVESVLGRGTTFFVEIPAHGAP